MRFAIQATADGSSARAGRIETAHGVIETPVFMPVGTRGTVRTQTLGQLTALGPRIVLANTYHLGRRPGAEALARFGGLHRWMGWPGAILTDSGGFQVFSLGAPVDEAGARIAGEAMTPERSIAIQRAIGADIMMVMDHCVASTSARGVAAEAMHRTHRWARRSLAAREGSAAALFAIVQGACDPALRRESADTLVAIGGFDGYAIGGLAVGEARREREDVTALVTARLPADRPRYLMGVGMPIDLLEAVHRGVDMFDCILPTALAQQGVAFTSRGRLDLARGVYRLAEDALDPACGCEACARPRSYLHHLIKCGEPVGWQLIAHHNLAFYLRLMSEIRTAVLAGEFAAYYRRQRPVLEGGDPDHPPGRGPRVKPKKPRQRGAFALELEGGARIVEVASGARVDGGVDVARSAVLARALAGGAPIVAWDVGLGAGETAMAVIAALERHEGHAAIELISVAADLDAFRLALAHVEHFAHLRHRAPHVVAQRGRFERERFTWSVRASFADAPRPDVIFGELEDASVIGVERITR